MAIAIGNGPGSSVRGLKLWRHIGESTFVSRIDGKAVVVDLRVVRTYPAEHAADLMVSGGGEKEDLDALGIMPGERQIRIDGFEMAEVVPGVLAGIGIRGEGPGTSATGVSLVISAARELWEIEREEAFTARMLGLLRSGKILGLSSLKKPSVDKDDQSKDDQSKDGQS